MNDLYTLEVDLHTMTVAEARQYLKSTLNSMPRHIREVRIIHGYRGGRELQKFVRHEFNHKKVERKILELNQGMTTYMIKQ